mgnify:CR=1 FL=1
MIQSSIWNRVLCDMVWICSTEMDGKIIHFYAHEENDLYHLYEFAPNSLRRAASFNSLEEASEAAKGYGKTIPWI